MTDTDTYPPLVLEAASIARELGFPLTHEEDGGAGPSCSLPDVGRLLATLAAGCRRGRIGELGSGTGFGAAWIASAMPPDATLVTVEWDEERARRVQELFAGDPRVRVLHGDATALMPAEAPFDLLFVDAGVPVDETLIDIVRIGGQLVMDDVTATAALPPGSPYADPRTDVKRALFFGSSRLQSVEIVLPDLVNAVLLGTRLS